MTYISCEPGVSTKYLTVCALGERMTDGINPLDTCTCIYLYHSMLNVYIIPMDHYFKQNVNYNN